MVAVKLMQQGQWTAIGCEQDIKRNFDGFDWAMPVSLRPERFEIALNSEHDG